MPHPSAESPDSLPTAGEPTLHFVSRKMRIGADESSAQVAVSEFVKKDQLLISIPASDKKLPESPDAIQAGQNTYLNDTRDQIYASIAGYPRIDRRQDVRDDSPVVSVEPLFRISPDHMRTTLAIHPPLDGCCSLVNEDIEQLLVDAGIVFGVDGAQVETAREYIQEAQIEFRNFIIARGRMAEPGTDASLKFEIEIGPIPGKLLANGSMDFRERLIMVPVSAGQLIAIKVPAVRGKQGTTVFGEETAAQDGKDIRIKTRNEARYDDETREVIATGDGVLSVVGNDVIKVCSKQEISGDINYATGNVESRNSVVVYGSVLPGFKVLTDGNLEIHGSVTSAAVSSRSNLVIKGGVTGNNPTLFASGDIDIYFVERGTLESEGNCIIRRQCYYSHVVSGGSICCPKESAIIGGELIGAESITVGDVGSKDSVPALLAAGVIGERYKHYQNLKQSLIEQQKEVVTWLQRYRGNPRARKLRKMEREVEQIRLQLLRMNLIPESGLYSRANVEGDMVGVAKEEFSDKDSIDISRIVIEVHGTIHAGSRLQIGNRTMTLEKTVIGRQFRLDAAQSKIIAAPLNRW